MTRRRTLTKGFAVPNDTMEGFYWNPLQGQLVLMPDVAPEGCCSEAHIDRMLERPTDGQPCRMLMLVATTYYESSEHRRKRRRETMLAARKTRRTAKRSTTKRTTKGRAKP